MLRIISSVLARDLLLAVRQRADVLNILFFYVVIATLVPLGVGADPNLLRSIAPGIVWVSALLAANLSLARLFAADHADGTLEQMLLSPEPLALVVLAKAAAHWLVCGLPITLIAALLGLMYDLGTEPTLVLMTSLLLGTPVLSLIGAIGAALTLGLRGSGVLASLLVLPLYVPVLVFGAGAVETVMTGLAPRAHLLLLAAMLLVAAVLTPWAVSAALRISAE
jgi:heme exporter protein B